MSQLAADTNATGLATCKTRTPDANTVWKNQQPNDISAYSPELESVARNPISLNRGGRKGTITNLTASPAFVSDSTLDHILYFGNTFLFSVWKEGATVVTDPDGLSATAATVTGYTVDAGGDLDAGTLVYASGWANLENNGLKEVEAGSTGTNVAVSGLVDETAPATSRLYRAGVRGATGDIQIDADGNLISTTLDFTTLPLLVGQFLWIGGEDEANRFDTAENRGAARIVTIAANKIELTKRAAAFTADTGAGKDIDLYFGYLCHDVPVDDPDFLRTVFTMEAAYNLNPIEYEYATGAVSNTLALNLPVTDKSTMDFGFVAEDIEAPTQTRKPGTFEDFALNEAFNTSADVLRMRIQDESNNDISTYFRDTTLNIDNGVSPENILGVLGAAFINVGDFTVTVDTEVVFTDARPLAAIRNNETVSLDTLIRNNDGGALVDIPSMTLGDGSKSFPRNEKVKVTLAGQVFTDDLLGYGVSISVFPYLPSA